MKSIVQALNIKTRAQALTLVQSLESVPLETKKYFLMRVLVRIWNHTFGALKRGTDLNLEQWRQLEYRNEFVTREGERMNHFGIR